MKKILNGIDKFDFGSLVGRRIGVIVNYSSVTKNLDHMLDIIHHYGVLPKYIFVPEHGLYGTFDTENSDTTHHPVLKIPIVGIFIQYNEFDTILEELDVLIYDIQDVGLRFFTFAYSLAKIMECVSKTNIELVVLDRINPLGRQFFGPRIPKELNSIVGAYALPARYGLTVGELALYYKKFLRLDVNLKIVKCEGWSGEFFNETDLLWNVPSPNLPTFSSVLCYAGMCIFEATNMSVGRGTTKPFEFFGAPWLDNDDMLNFLRGRFPRLRVRKREFIPMFREYAGQVCYGVEFFPTVEDNFFEIAVELFKYLQKYDEFTYDNVRLDQLTGVKDFAHDPDKLLDFDLSDYLDFVSDIILYR